MQPRDAGRLGDIPQPMADKLRISPPANYRDGIRVHANSKRPGKRDGERRSGNGRPTDCSRRLTLAKKPHPIPKTKTHIERTLRKARVDARLYALLDSHHDWPHRATNGGLSGLPAIIRSLHVSGEPSPGAISALPPNNATPWHQTAVCTRSPYTSRQSMHCHVLHLYTTHNTTTPYIPNYFSTTPPPEFHEYATKVPTRMDMGNSHIPIAHTIEHQGCGEHQSAP